MKKRITIVGTLVALLALALTTTALAGRGRHDGRGRGPGGDRMDEMTAALNLSAEQQKQVEKLKGDMKANADKNRDRMRTAHEKMKGEWQKDTIDKNAIRAIQKELHGLKGQMGEARLEFMLAMNDILTKEQRAQARDMFKRHGKEGKGPGEGRKDGRGPDGERGFGPGGPGCPCEKGPEF